MKILKIITVFLIICGVILLSTGCSKSSATSVVTTRTATVQKGNLSVSITGTGNLAYSTTEELAFEMAGYVEEVLVSAGDTVKEGQELAKLNTSDWEDSIKALDKKLTSAERSLSSAQSNVTKAQRGLTTSQSNVTQAQRSLTTAQYNVTKVQRVVTDTEMSVQQAQLDLETGQYNLSQMDDVKTAQNAVDNAESNIQIAKSNLKYAGLIKDGDESSYWTQQISYLEQQLEQAKSNLQKVLNKNNTTLSTSVVLQIAQYQLKIDQSKRQVEAAQIAVAEAKTAVNNALLDEAEAKTAVDNALLDEADAKTAVTNAQLDETEAEQAVKDAEDALAEAKGLSPIVKAPFEGFITKVNVKGGDEVFKGSVAAVISDPNKFEANIMVTENDIFSVKLEGEAAVSLDALADITYPAKITRIAPTATVSSGVVNYAVTVELTSLTPVTTTRNTSPQIPGGTAPAGTIPVGSMPQGTPSAIPSQGTSGTTTSSANLSGATTSNTATSASSSQTISLKDGLSATVKIISQQANSVLIVPNKAITVQGQNSTVQVVKGTTTETRVVTTGMTDGTNTEISSGLSEGEQVTYKVSSSSSSSTKTSTQGSIGIGIGGGGQPPGGGF